MHKHISCLPVLWIEKEVTILYANISQMNKSANNEYVIHELIKERWSPRMFASDPLSDEELKSLFEAARWAPSSSNLQPWRFMYFRKGTESYERAFKCLSDFNQRWVKHAPILIFTAYKEKMKDGKENFHALHDLGLAMGNLTLQAQSMRLAVHQMAGIDWKKAQKDFQIEEGYHVSTAVAVGYYGGNVDTLDEELKEMEKAERKRMPQRKFVAEGKWPS
jgi:nitroreductase